MALQILVAPGQKNEDKKTDLNDALVYIQLLRDNVTMDARTIFNSASASQSYQDQVALWWANVISVACYWLLGEDSNAEKLYRKIETINDTLANTGNLLPKAIVAAFVARRNYLNDMPPKVVLPQCDHASQLLSDSLTFSSCKKRENLVMVSKLIVSFCI